VRVIGGKYKGKRFVPPKNFPSRPTTDFAKEALFNILENRYDFDELEVLDLFSGTGSIGLEFLSRGVKNVISIDNHSISCKFLKTSQESLNEKNWQIRKQDAAQFLKQTALKFDIIFADPPYEMKGSEELAKIVFERNLLNQNGILILEHGKQSNFEKITQFKELRNYGGVHFSFFEQTDL